MSDGLTIQARTKGTRRLGGALALGFAIAGAVTAAGCASGGTKKPDKITTELLSTPKEELFEKGKNLTAKKKWELGRKYLTFVFETYPNDPLGRDALLMVGDSFFRQGGTTGYTEARFRYRDYLNRYPGAPKRDYARYQFAVCYDKEHEKPDRDQTTTREAIEQYRLLMKPGRTAESGASPTSSRSTSSGSGTSTCGRGRRPRRSAGLPRSRSGFPSTGPATSFSFIRARPWSGCGAKTRPSATFPA